MAVDPRIPAYLGRVLDIAGTPTGTCFQVAPGILVTAHHLLDDADVLLDALNGAEIHCAARVVRLDAVHDLAVLQSDTALPASVPGWFATDRQPTSDRVVVTGVVRIDDPGHDTTYLDAVGTWSGGTTRDGGIPLGRLTSGDVMPGMSGAPVRRDTDGRIVGMVSGRYNSADGWLTHSVWIVRTEDIQALLADLGVDLPLTTHRAAAGLPSAPAAFSGRADELALLADHLDPEGRPSAVVVAGLPGVGKTALVTQAARSADDRGWCPGGVLFVDLRGYQDQPVQPGLALTMLLTALGLPGAEIPPDEQSRAQLYLSLLAQRARDGTPLLVVLDNAADEDQVRPLLPTDGTTRAVITSRHTLAGLDARQLDLDVLPEQAGAELLSGALYIARGGPDPRIEAEPDQLGPIVGLCGGLPLALRIVAALLIAHPARPLSVVSADLAEQRSRLDELRHRDIAVRAAFDLSYRLLPTEQARLFRLLPLGAGPDISTIAAAVLAGQDERTTRRQLDELVEAHLVEPGAVDGRWALHDLVRLFADELGQAIDSRSDRQTSAAFLFTHYYFTSMNAVDLLLRTVGRSLLAEQVPAPALVRAPSFATVEQAREWLAAEWRTVLAFATTPPPYKTSAAGLANGFERSLHAYLSLQGHFEELSQFCRVLVRSARELDDGPREAHASILLGRALRHVDQQQARDAQRKTPQVPPFRTLGVRGRTRSIAMMVVGATTDFTQSVDYLDEAIAAYQRAIELYRDLDDPPRLATTWSELGNAYREKDRVVRANAATARILDYDGTATATDIRDRIRDVGEIDNAIAAFREAVTAFAALDDRTNEVDALLDLASALNQADRLDDALAVTETAQSLAAGLDPLSHAQALFEHGRNLRAHDQLADAIAAFQQADARLTASGMRRQRLPGLIELYRSLDVAGQTADAIVVGEQTLHLSQEVGNRSTEADALLFLGWVATQQYDLNRAIALVGQAIQAYESLDRPHALTEAHRVLGDALRCHGDTADAIAHYKKARRLNTRRPDFDQRRAILFSLGLAYVQAGQWDDAEQISLRLALLRRPALAARIRDEIEQARQQE